MSAVTALLGGEVDPRTGAGRGLAGGRAGVARARRPIDAVIVAFDDAQHLPSTWLPDLTHLLRSMTDVPVLFLLGLRERFVLGSPSFPGATHGIVPLALDGLAKVVRLGPLGQELQHKFVESRLDVTEVNPALLSLLERTCEGNPLYMEEMLKFLIEVHRISIDGKRVLLTGEGDAGLPHTLQALITARIDALDAATRGLLQLAAVAGETFDDALIAEAAGLATRRRCCSSSCPTGC